MIDPVAEYDHSLGGSITGGYVYRGTQNTNLVGRYVFGDFVSGRIWAWIPESAPQPREPTQLLDTNLNIASFGQANDGELYVVHLRRHAASHRVRRPDRVDQPGATQSQRRPAASSPADPQQPAAGLIPYAINAPFWSDGATKERWLALAGQPERSPCAPTATGISRIARC